MEITFTDDPTGAAKLEAVVKAWGVVQEENKAQRKWVTEDQWNEWVRYDKETGHSLTNVIDGYDGVQLTEPATAILDRIIDSVGKAKRVTEEEFIARRDAEILAETQRKLQEDAEAEKKKALKGFKASLKGFFHL